MKLFQDRRGLYSLLQFSTRIDVGITFLCLIDRSIDAQISCMHLLGKVRTEKKATIDLLKKAKTTCSNYGIGDRFTVRVRISNTSAARVYFEHFIVKIPNEEGVLWRKDFNIMEEADGVSRGISIDADDVMVNGSTLEIHLYWVGKGTTAIPDRGVYGPLIFAITITPNLQWCWHGCCMFV
ncbi:hypothetical protein L6452_02255 [Arctium lappa]|uniref:Uncharacterized protein n=1 Tax=Arctium lappa TaxID=4217 RepID=A0ACB9FIC0_ARCLA|nr:hypothetical protein L6452_02255 [Arctium lappa]